MSKCCPPIEKIGIAGLDKIPLFRYLRDPVMRFGDLQTLYPAGGEHGWFVFVHDEKTFAYWDTEDNEWKLLNNKEPSIEQLRYMEITQEEFFMGKNDVQKITITIYDGYNRDKTHEFGQINVTRDSNDPHTDSQWDIKHGMNKGREFEITFDDLNIREDNLKTTFTVIAIRGSYVLTTKIKIDQHVK